MDTPGMNNNPESMFRRMKFPRTKRDRFREEGKLYESRDDLDGGGVAAHQYPQRTYDELSMPQYPMPPIPPPQHNVTFDLPDQTSSSATGDVSESDENDEETTKTNGNNNKKGALTGTTFNTNRVPQTDATDNGDARPWIAIQKVKNEDGTDSAPVLGPPGRTPPPQRKDFKDPDEEDDEDDVFYDETVPDVVFNDEFHHPSYGNYIPGQYQHTLDYLYGLETIREVDESMIHQEHFKEKASTWDILVMFVTLLFYFANVGMDVWLAFEYFSLGHYIWFALTLLFVLLPSVVMSIYSLILYVRDQRLLKVKTSRCRWSLRAAFLLLLVAPAMRIIDTISYGVKSRSADDWRMRRRNFDKMLDEDTDSCLVRLFETFLENAPQLVLQLYVLARLGTGSGTFLVVLQISGLIISVLAMAWSLVSYQASLRSSLPDKAPMNWTGKCLMFFWRVMTISARVIAIALFASYFTFYVFAFIGAHFLLMLFWMTKQNTSYCMVEVKDEEGNVKKHHSKFLEFCFRIMAAFVHIFCFFNLLEGHTRLRCLVFYILMYAENLTLIMCWNLSASTLDHAGWYQMPALAMILGGFFIGIFFQIAYYLWAHPNHWSQQHRHRRIRLCVPWKELSLFNAIHIPGEEYMNERKPVMGGQSGHPPPPGVVPPMMGVAHSDAGASSSVGPFVAPMETSTPAPSTVGLSPPQLISTPKTSPQPLPAPAPEELEDTPQETTKYVPHDRPTIEIKPIGGTPSRIGEKPIPKPRSRPTTPARELEIVPERPSTPGNDQEKVETEV